MITIVNEKLVIDDVAIEESNLIFIKEISRGANGIVFLAKDRVLGRKVALKLWLKLKVNETRDKVKQGELEAKKQWSAKEIVENWKDKSDEPLYFIPDESDSIPIHGNLVGQVYYVGYYKDYFYAVMEYIEGTTLKNFLITNKGIDEKIIPFGVKVNIALKLNRYHKVFISKDIVHGDLHWKNVMISNFSKTHSITGECYHTYDIRIIDFGTSYFTGENVSIKRSFDTLIETINHCIYPFNLKEIKSNDYPEDINDYQKVSSWIEKQLFALRAAFYELGQEYVGWPLYRAFGTYEITTKGFDIETQFIKEKIEEQVKCGNIIMSKVFLGESKDWDSFDGRTAVRRD